MLLFFIIAALIIAVTAVVFAIQNAAIILVSFFLWQFQGSLALILLLTFVLGFIAGLLIILPKLIKGSIMIAGQKKKIEDFQKTPEKNLEKKEESL